MLFGRALRATRIMPEEKQSNSFLEFRHCMDRAHSRRINLENSPAATMQGLFCESKNDKEAPEGLRGESVEGRESTGVQNIRYCTNGAYLDIIACKIRFR